MSSLPQKCLVDTNVPKTANLALDPDKIPQELIDCVLACVEAVEHVVKKGGLVMDLRMKYLMNIDNNSR